MLLILVEHAFILHCLAPCVPPHLAQGWTVVVQGPDGGGGVEGGGEGFTGGGLGVGGEGDEAGGGGGEGVTPGPASRRAEKKGSQEGEPKAS